MKKSFAENCIRYISTATALILALAMLCCANFSASAKNLGSNLTITDTTLLLEDINTTTNTTPAKTKDLIASGANVELVSTGITVGDTLYFCSTTEYSTVYAYIWKKDGSSYNTWDSEEAMTPLGNIDGKYYYSYTLIGSSTTDFDRVIFKKGSGDANKLTSDVTIDSNNNCYDLDNTSWSTYSGGSSGTTTKTVYFDNSDSQWENVYAWVWKSGNDGESVQLTRVGTTNVYSMEVSTDKDCVIFKPNSGTNFDPPRTKDLTSSLSNNMADGYMFSFSNYSSTSNQNTGTWTEYSATTTYTVTFHANGHGTRPDAQTVTSGGKATVPTPPTAEGWTFSGWYKESECTNEYDFDTPVTGNLDLYAKWTAISTSTNNRYYVKVTTSKTGWWNNSGCDHVAELSTGTKITLKAVKNDNTASSTSKANGDVYYFDVPTSSTATSFKLLRCSPGTQNQFDGNNTDFISFVAGKNYLSEFEQSKTTATWGNYTPITISGDTECDVDSTITLTATKTTICREDITGISWKSSDDAIATVNGSGVVTGVSEGEVTITAYNTSNENIFATYNVKINTNVVNYTVSFDANGHGTAPSAQTVIENESATEPTPAPTETGYTFGGWYKESTCVNEYDFNTAVTGDLTLYAKWTANKYTVSFDSQGGDNTPADMEVTYDGTYVGLPTAAGTKKGHTFTGWYTSATDGTKVTETTPVKITEPQTLYAHWTANIYNITYKSGTETLSGHNPTTYTYGDGATLPATATKEGYTFKGWYANEDLTGKPVTSISTDETEDKTFYAKWELNAFKHKYVFLDVSGCDWFYNNKCVGVVYFNNDNVTKTTTGYTEMTELFTDDSGYESRDGKAQHSKLLFAEVPSDTTKITFARHGSGDYNNNYNITNFGYSNFTTNNCFKITGGGDNDSSASGTWSEKTYNPVPIDFSVVGNGSVAFKNTVSPEITVSNGGTIYADKASTALKVKATPSENYEVSIFTINGENKLVSIADESVGGTVDVGTLGNTNTVEVTFKASANPIVTIPTVEHSSVTFIYLDENGVRQTKENASGDYTVQFGSTITLNIIPDDGYYVKSVSDNLTPTDTLPKAGTITATATQVKEDLTVSYELAQNPKVTIDVPSNCTVDFTYINGNGVEATAHTAGTYSVYYGSNISYKVTPADDYYVASMTGVTTKTPTPPVAEAVTGTISNITADVADTITCTLNPNPTVTIECYDSTGTKIESGAGITVDGGTVALTKQSKSVLYNSETGVTFTASVDAEDVHQYRFLGYYTTKKPIGSPITSGGIDDYNVTVTEKSINIYRVTSDITLYAIFSQQYKVTFNYENLTNFTVDGTAVATGGSVYVSAGANLSLEATLSDDYKLTNDCWSITPTGVGTFAPNGTNASYTVGTSDVEITITPQIATYTGEGKWGSKILKIDTSGVGASKTGYDPWFAVSFKKSSTDTNDYFIRCSKVSDGLYECVIPDGYTHFDIYRMATGATAFTTEVESKDGQLDSTKAWNKTNSTTNIGTNTSYKLSYNGTVGQMSIATN